MRIVLDTNVLVSAALGKFGPPGRIVKLVLNGKINAVIDDRILREYQEVLVRPKLKIDPVEASRLLDYFEADTERVVATEIHTQLPDADDQMFLEVAISAEVDCIVTGNRRHFPSDLCSPIRGCSPAEFIEEYSKQ